MARFSFVCALIFFCKTLLLAQAEIEDYSLYPEQIASIEADKDNLILGVISPVSGQLSLRSLDLVSKGVENLSLSRTYVSPYLPLDFDNLGHFRKGHRKRALAHFFYHDHVGWQQYGNLEILYNPKTRILHLKDKSGASIPFRREKDHIRFVGESYGISNLCSNVPLRLSDPRHIKGEFVHNSLGLIVTLPDGTIRYYEKAIICIEYLSLDSYRLVKETLPSGRCVGYHLTQEGLKIRSYDPSEKLSYAELLRTNESNHLRIWKTKENKEAQFSYLDAVIKGTAKKANCKEKFALPIKNLLTHASTPFNRNETLNYTPQYLIQEVDNSDYKFQVAYKPFGEPAFWRVSEITFPIGDQNIKVRIEYIPATAGQSCGMTTVYFDDGTFMRYHISEKLLVDMIEQFDSAGSLVKQKCFRWLPNNYIESIAICDANRKCLFETFYQYDEVGNPIKETLIGNLTGNGSKETYSVYKKYANDRFSNLIQEIHESGKVISYTYLTGTNLITSKITSDSHKIYLREFFIYDEHHNLMSEISDDGSQQDPQSLVDVTVRKLKKYQLRQSGPFLHMPEVVAEYALMDHKETLLNFKKLKYDPFGNLIEEQVFDAKGCFLYATSKTYNERGDVLTKQDPMGCTFYYEYDQKGRCILSKNGSGRLITSLKYDTKGRLTSKSELGDERIKQNYLYDYDSKDRLIKQIDPYGNSKSFDYPAFLEKPTEEHLPELETITFQGRKVCKTFEYDALGNKLVEVDALGNKTIYAYNARNQITKIQYPSGAKQEYRYYLDGSLASLINQDGLQKAYLYDVLGNLLQIDYISSDGKYLASEYFEYKGKLLVSSTTKEGQTTRFCYDGSGRKIKEDFEGRIKEYEYDDLNHLIKVIIHNDSNTLVTHYQKDFLDQIQSEEKTDLNGQILLKKTYCYDADGNRIEKSLFINNHKSTFTSSFDSFGRCLTQIDPKGYHTRFSYDDKETNALGQRCLKVIKTNPRDIKTVSVYNPHGKLVLRQTLNSSDEVIASSKNIYDAELNLTYHIEELYENGHHVSSQIVKNTYNPMSLLASSTRGYLSKDQKVTCYNYKPSGKLSVKKLSSGVELYFEYDDLGYLKTLRSSDAQINHSFVYSLEGALLQAHDHVSGYSFKRTLNQFEEILKETFSTDITIERAFDQIGRVTQVTFDRHGDVSYVYDPMYLTKIIRTSAQNLSYTHRFDEYDISGRCVKETLPESLGIISRSYDIRGCLSKLKTPYCSQEYHYDASCNLVLKDTEESKICLRYDSQDQLIQEDDRTYSYDSLHNRQNDSHNSLNELLDLSYDALGNLAHHHEYTLTYDSLNRLVKAESEDKLIEFGYDPIGRCLKRSSIDKLNNVFSEPDIGYFLFDGFEEVGFISATWGLKDFKVNSPSQELVAVELNTKAFSALVDPFGNTQKIVDITNAKQVIDYECGAFGDRIEIGINPWVYKGKRFDKDLALVNFGSRFYDPKTGRWCSIDPQGSLDSYNLYQYVFNNPQKYKDPNGEFIIALPLLIWGAELILPAITAWAVPALYTGATVAFAYAGYKYAEMLNDRSFASQEYLDYVLHSEIEDEKKKPEPRTKPKDLSEQLALEEAKANEGRHILQDEIKDPRYRSSEWKKMTYNHQALDGTKKEIHYWENAINGEKHNFKFKD